MGVVKQIDIKSRTYYFYNDIIDLKKFDARLLQIDKKSYKNIYIYCIGYMTIENFEDRENIYSIYPLYLLIDHANGYIVEKNGNKCLIFDSVDENKEVLKKYTDVWNGIKNKIKDVSSGKRIMKKIT